ncbi:MAG: DNA-3-methyladenine glycosylase family protein [Thermoplasmatota archaeon]
MDALVAARAHWEQTDPVLADLAARTEIPERLQNQLPAFASLVRAIVGQQVSIQAAQSLYDRLAAATGPEPARILASSHADLRACGLSNAKVASVQDLAEHVLDGQLDLDGLAMRSDADAIDALVQVRGIGVWTAKMHLMFHLQRPDVCPWEDLGIRQAVTAFYGVPPHDATAWLKEHHGRWSPYNSLAARVLWAARRD